MRLAQYERSFSRELAKAPHRHPKPPYRSFDALLDSLKNSGQIRMQAASFASNTLAAAWEAKAGLPLTENYRSLTRRWTSLNHKQ